MYAILDELILMNLDAHTIQMIGEHDLPKDIWLKKKNGSLREAIQDNNLDGVKYLIESNIINLDKEKYKQALRLSAKLGYLNIVKYIVEHAIKYNIDVCSDYRSLFEAVRYGQLNVVQYLFEHNGSSNYANEPFIVRRCITNDHLHIIQYLDRYWNIADYSNALIASMSGHHVEIVNYLFEQCGNHYQTIIGYLIAYGIAAHHELDEWILHRDCDSNDNDSSDIDWNEFVNYVMNGIDDDFDTSSDNSDTSSDNSDTSSDNSNCTRVDDLDNN
jgi:hypothetical protein